MMGIVRETKDVRHVLLKLGVALALSFAGFLYSRFKTKRIGFSRPPPPPPPPAPESLDCGSGAGRIDGLRGLQAGPRSSKIAPIATDECAKACAEKDNADDFLVCLSASSNNDGEKDKFLLPEFKDIMKEFESVSMNGEMSSARELERRESDVEKPIAFRTAENDEYEQEINQLRDMVRGLRERERNLEVQLLEYYGLKEQEETVMELQNRLHLNNTEFKHLNLKIESLQADKQKLETQLADYPKVVAELEEARAKMKLLEQKLRCEAAHNRKQILALKQRVEKFRDRGYENANCDPDVRLRLKDLENEAEELRSSNIKLQLENSELAESLESTQIIANSALEHQVAEEAKKLSHRLKQENEDLLKKMEQLHADRCADVEELVYLRWLNACLRYELRNYRTVAKDLNMTMSPKSEEKAKQLILEYANTEGSEDKRGLDVFDLYSDMWSSSQADSSEHDDSSAFNSSANGTSHPKKTKFLGKIRKFLGVNKTQHHHRHDLHDQGSLADRAASPEMRRTNSSESGRPNDATAAGSSTGRVRSLPATSTFRRSLDMQRLKSVAAEDFMEMERARRYSDAGHFNACKKIIPSGGVADDSPQDAVHKSSLLKYAEALSHSHCGKPSHRKSKSVPLGWC